MSKMKIENRVEKLGALKAEIDALNEKYEELKKELIEELEAEGKKNAESKSYKVTLSVSNRYSYKDAVYEWLREVAPKAIKDAINTPALNALLKAEVITESELNKYREATVTKTVLVKEKS